MPKAKVLFQVLTFAALGAGASVSLVAVSVARHELARPVTGPAAEPRSSDPAPAQPNQPDVSALRALPLDIPAATAADAPARPDDPAVTETNQMGVPVAYGVPIHGPAPTETEQMGARVVHGPPPAARSDTYRTEPPQAPTGQEDAIADVSHDEQDATQANHSGPNELAAPVMPQTASQASALAPDQMASETVSLVDLNTASLEELNTLNGGGLIGRAIVRGRPYQSLDDLLRKRVLNRATFERIKNQVAVR